LGPTVLLTGGTRGLGKATATQLTQAGATVVMVARDPDLGSAAADEIRSLSPKGAVDVLVGDLSKMNDVRRIAADVSAKHPRLSLLINNAGVSKFTREVTVDGLETTFATNHLAPFLLSNLLIDVLAPNAPARIVNITSEQHRWVRAIPWDDLQSESRFQPIEVYSLSKLYNILFTLELARRAKSKGVAVNCMSPGFLRTGLGREATGFFRLFLQLSRPFQKPATVGAAAVIRVSESHETGRYFKGALPAEPSALARDATAAARLWEISSDLAGLRPGDDKASGPASRSAALS
jgi:NAD(P)-dependent dehydrogenase (short-subunit alcohol dehydrogenase family)